MLTLHLNALEEKNPRAVVPVERPKGEDPKFADEYLSGHWLRVFPATARDVAFLLSTEHQLDRFPPSSGHGVLLAARCLEGLYKKKMA